MADTAAQVNAGAQLRTAQTAARRARTPYRKAQGTVLRLRKNRGNRLNIQPVQDTFPNLQTIAQRQSDDQLSKLQKLMLEQQNAQRLAIQRQQIRAQMKAFQLPADVRMAIEDLPQDGQELVEEVYQNELNTPEFEQRVNQTLDKQDDDWYTRSKKKKQKEKIKKAKEKAKEAADEFKKAVEKGEKGTKKVWDAANELSAADAADPFDLEAPTIFATLVEMYRACTAVLNNGKKIFPGFLGFFEPPPLVRFWKVEEATGISQDALSKDKQELAKEVTEKIPDLIQGMVDWLWAVLGFGVIGLMLIQLFSFLIVIAFILMLFAYAESLIS